MERVARDRGQGTRLRTEDWGLRTGEWGRSRGTTGNEEQKSRRARPRAYGAGGVEDLEHALLVVDLHLLHTENRHTCKSCEVSRSKPRFRLVSNWTRSTSAILSNYESIYGSIYWMTQTWLNKAIRQTSCRRRMCIQIPILNHQLSTFRLAKL